MGRGSAHKKTMAPYILKRVLGTIPVLFVASILIFLIVHLLPGDPLNALLPEDPAPEQVEALRKLYGFDKPLYAQYGIWVANVLQGNLGISIATGWNVVDLLALKLSVTFQLTAFAFLLAVVIALPIGIYAGLNPSSWFNRYFLSVYTSLGFAIPTFWLGIIFIIVFGITLRMLPTSGFVSLFEDPVRGLRFMVLPGLTLAIPESIIFANFIASSVQTVRKSEYVTAAIAKGLPPSLILRRHILRNALIPVVAVAAVIFGQTMAGSVITESVFGIPGFGQLLVQAISARDIAVLQANLMLLVVIFTFANLCADLFNSRLDPRISYE